MSRGPARGNGAEQRRRSAEMSAAVETLPLVDHHLHSIFRGSLTRERFESGLTEAFGSPRPGATRFDSQLGFAVRKWCAPLLELPPFACPEDYLARRSELGEIEVNRRLLRAAGCSDLLVDGGYVASELVDIGTLAALADSRAHSILRLESVAEAVARTASEEGFVDELERVLRDEGAGALGFKSIAAYRCGLGFDPAAPAADEVRAAGRRFVAQVQGGGQDRLTDAVLIRHLIWYAVEDGRPLQLHVGFGDPDLLLGRSNPLLLQGFIERTQDRGTPVMLLHCYPYHREAAMLAHLFGNVFVDLGLAINHAGANSVAMVRELMELAPFDRILYSSDAVGLPELIYLGATLWRNSILEVLSEFVERDGWPVKEAIRVAFLIGRANAAAVYGIPDAFRP